MKKCHYCAEEIKDEAIKCKHCGEFIKEVPVVAKWEVHLKYLERFFGAVCAFVACFLWIKFGTFFALVTAIVFYFIGANFLTETITGGLQTYIAKEWKPQKLTATLGYIDRAIYAVCVALGKEYYQFIGIWLGIKVVSRILDKPSEDDVQQGQRKNTYLIGNIVSLGFGVYGGILIKRLFDI